MADEKGRAPDDSPTSANVEATHATDGERSVTRFTASVVTGPLDDPERMGRYYSIDPALGLEVIRMTNVQAEHRRAFELAEASHRRELEIAEAKHRHAAENSVILAEQGRATRGQRIGMILTITGFGLTAFALHTGNPVSASILGTFNLVGLVAQFASAKNSRV